MQNLLILNLQGDHVRGHTNFGSISSVVLTFIGHRQTDRHTNKQSWMYKIKMEVCIKVIKYFIEEILLSWTMCILMWSHVSCIIDL